ncbi:hypothetical protein FOXYSP1_14546 [Fusarium oxysporum f. sp. phaseoli]
MRRCAIVINDGQRGCDWPVDVVNGYVTSQSTNINNIRITRIRSLHFDLRSREITSEYLPDVDELQPIQQVPRYLFGCQVLIEGTSHNTRVIQFIRRQRKALEGLADQLKSNLGVSARQQAFIDSIASAGGNLSVGC